MRKLNAIGAQCKAMKDMKSGASFILETDQGTAFHYAVEHGIKISTKVCLIVEEYQGEEPRATRAVRVTIL